MNERTKTLGGGLLVVISCSLIFWNLGRETRYPSKDADNYSKTPEARSLQVSENDFSNPKKSLRITESKHTLLEVIDQLETMASGNPRLVERLYLRLFDNNLDLNEDDWALIGINRDTAAIVSEDLKSIFKKIKENEAKNFSIVDQSDRQIKVFLPRIKAEEAASLVAQLQSSFAKVLGPELSKTMTGMFIARQPAITAGLDGRDRVVTITTASDNAVTELHRKYEIRTQVLYPGTRLSDAIMDLDNYSQDSVIELVESIPDNWFHIFGKSD